MIPIASLALLISAASPRTIPEEKEEGERSTILVSDSAASPRTIP
jgi:hypothetical protein